MVTTQTGSASARMHLALVHGRRGDARSTLRTVLSAVRRAKQVRRHFSKAGIVRSCVDMVLSLWLPACCVAPVAAQVSGSSTSAASLRQEAQQLWFEGKYSEAAAAYGRLASLYARAGRVEDLTSALAQAGESRLMLGQYVQARYDFRAAYAADSTRNGAKADAYDLVLVALSFRVAGLADSAMPAYDRARSALQRQGVTGFLDAALNEARMQSLTSRRDSLDAEIRRRHPDWPMILCPPPPSDTSVTEANRRWLAECWRGDSLLAIARDSVSRAFDALAAGISGARDDAHDATGFSESRCRSALPRSASAVRLKAPEPSSRRLPGRSVVRRHRCC